MLKNYKINFENGRKIERHSFHTERERERRNFEKLSASASGAQKFPSERWVRGASASRFSERTKALAISRVDESLFYACVNRSHLNSFWSIIDIIHQPRWNLQRNSFHSLADYACLFAFGHNVRETKAWNGRKIPLVGLWRSLTVDIFYLKWRFVDFQPLFKEPLQ